MMFVPYHLFPLFCVNLSR